MYTQIKRSTKEKCNIWLTKQNHQFKLMFTELSKKNREKNDKNCPQTITTLFRYCLALGQYRTVDFVCFSKNKFSIYFGYNPKIGSSYTTHNMK